MIRLTHNPKLIIREIIAHWQIRHHNIVKLIGIHLFDKQLVPSMILRRAEHPSVMDYLESHPEPEAFIKLVCNCFVSPTPHSSSCIGDRLG